MGGNINVGCFGHRTFMLILPSFNEGLVLFKIVFFSIIEIFLWPYFRAILWNMCGSRDNYVDNDDEVIMIVMMMVIMMMTMMMVIMMMMKMMCGMCVEAGTIMLIMQSSFKSALLTLPKP